MSQFESGQRRICSHWPSQRLNTEPKRRSVRPDAAPSAGVELFWSGPGPAAADDDEGA
ncbi:hypothetical protein [Mycobacterium sp. 852002-51971_SCH5477799-a]|uniref:hypothetical protein n=1 Tax=Mycobacterium sp. 852002-51971_SCH5477799-a TaxID=1834106 RepID=UPI000A408DE0|nr:hypothetical protein [Mycobacterium sp. 852002-51971_SCH5477799-a]